MIISELIESLEKIKSQKGDIDVQYQCAEFGPTKVDYVIFCKRDLDSDGSEIVLLS